MHTINLQLVFASISLLLQYQLLYRGNAYTRKYQYLEISRFLTSLCTCAKMLPVLRRKKIIGLLMEFTPEFFR